jgi:hypothetical protein
MSILDDESILVSDIKDNAKKNIKLIWDCRTQPKQDVLDVVKHVFFREDIAKDLRWESCLSNNNIYFLKKTFYKGNTSFDKPIIKIIIDESKIRLCISEYDVYYVFDINSHRVLDIQKEFTDWIWDLGFNSQKYYFQDNCKVFYFNPSV